MSEPQIDAQKVIDSLIRQIADMAGKVAMLEALLAQEREQSNEKAD